MTAEEIIKLLQRIRHDFANHLQVISGYLELGRQQEVKDYIAGIVEDMAGERRIFETLEPETTLYFFERILLARDMGIILRYKDLKINSLEIMRAAHEPEKTLNLLSSQLKEGEEDAVVSLSLYEEDGEIHMHLSGDLLPQSSLRVIIKE